MNEEWRDVVDYEGLYMVSNLGRVKSLERRGSRGYKVKERILTGTIDKNGYIIVNLRKDNKNKQFKVHRLVAIAFIPNPENKPFIDHINTICNDNRVDNLRWCTQKENCNNELSKKKLSESIKGKNVGEKNGMYGKKHSEETKKKMSKAHKGSNNFNSRKVRCIELDKVFNSIIEAEEELGLFHQNIGKACRGIYKTCGGYHWEYINN